MKATTETPTKQRVDQTLRNYAADGLIAIGHELHGRGWSRATSSNYSVRLSDPSANTAETRLLVTASGKHKDRLTRDDFVLIDGEGRAVEADALKSSAETMLHVVLAAETNAGAILHTHSVWGTLLSDRFASEGKLIISGYEMLKALDEISTHDASAEIDIFANTQDISAMGEQLRSRLTDKANPLKNAFLIQKHGLYTWGKDLDAARASLEALEFLFECEARRLGF